MWSANGYQLVGLAIAAFQIPVLSPDLGKVEDAVAALGRCVRQRLRVADARIAAFFGKPIWRSGSARVSDGGSPRTAIGQIEYDYTGTTVEEKADRALDEIAWLRKDARALERGGSRPSTDPTVDRLLAA